MASNVYSNGNSLFQIKLAEVDPSCRFIEGNSGAGVAQFNLAFRLVYQGRQNIAKCKNPKLKARLVKELEHDMRSGYDDMYDACKHVFSRINEKHIWTDTMGTTYGSLKGFTMPASGARGHWVVPAAHRNWPDPIWNFRKAVEKRGQMQKDLTISTFLPNTAKIVDGFDKSAFNGVTALLAKWRNDMDRLDKFAWILDPSAEEEFQFKAAKKRLSYTSALSRLESVLDTAKQYRDADFNDTSSVAFALLTEAVDFIPVFGTFYGKMLKPLPGFFNNFRTLFESRLRRQLNP